MGAERACRRRDAVVYARAQSNATYRVPFIPRTHWLALGKRRRLAFRLCVCGGVFASMCCGLCAYHGRAPALLNSTLLMMMVVFFNTLIKSHM